MTIELGGRMPLIESLVGGVPLPRMALARQVFDVETLEDVAAGVAAEFAKPESEGAIRAGAEIAITVGSRGMNRLPELTAAIVSEVKKRGGKPFIAPSMGSHGGATAEGQEKLLAKLGVTAATAGCPIRSSMEVVELDRLPNGLPVLMDREAMAADGIIVMNRIKPHTSFSGDYESGMVKMLSIGMGNQKGADSCHALGFGQMAQSIVEMARIKLAKCPVVLGIASIENAYDQVSRIVVVPANRILEVEPDLLIEARRKMPRLLIDPVDVLVVDRIGKEFSGTGADPNITGRAATSFVRTTQRVERMAMLDLSDKSAGNATGIGLADSCCRRLVDKIDFEATYANPLTSTVLAQAKIPMTFPNDRLAIQACVKTCGVVDMNRIRMVRVANTLEIGTLMISEALIAEADSIPGLEVAGEAADLSFDGDGNLTDLGGFHHQAGGQHH